MPNYSKSGKISKLLSWIETNAQVKTFWHQVIIGPLSGWLLMSLLFLEFLVEVEYRCLTILNKEK